MRHSLGMTPRIKLTSNQEDILKKICCDSEGATGCRVSITKAIELLRLDLVRLAPTRRGIEYLTDSEVLTPEQVESWIKGIKRRDARLAGPKVKQKTKKQMELEANIAKAEESDRIWREEQKAKRAALEG